MARLHPTVLKSVAIIIPAFTFTLFLLFRRLSTPILTRMATALGLSTAKEKETLLPGFGRPVNYVPSTSDPDFVEELFPNALSAVDMEDGRTAQRMITVREMSMMQFMNSVTDKPDWHLKARPIVNDEEIAKKWKQEALASTADFTEMMAEYCIQELRYRASLLRSTPDSTLPPIIVYNGDVFKSDHALPASFKAALQDAVSALEAKIPERLRDWHPGSDGKVWDLVHPSLFPLVYGKTRVLEKGEKTTLGDCVERCGEGRVAPLPEEKSIVEARIAKGGYWTRGATPFSARFQWLPCDVDISGPEAKITSYINNLHPAKEQPLYSLIERLIDASIPLWDMSLTALRNPHSHTVRIAYDGTEYDPDPGSWPRSEGPQQEEDEDRDDYCERRQAWIKDTRVLVMPEPKLPFEPPPEVQGGKKVDLRKGYGERGLQVIVKLANIQLTPKKPEYEGGSWHVEGQLNEHIVATALYYYDSSNITPSTLAFRQQVDAEQLDHGDISYEQEDHDWLGPIFGCAQDEAAVQDVGSVLTLEGRLLTFPNVLQHRVGRFRLEDPTKEGHRKIVALFLVDPNIRVIGTGNVPCQQQEWWWEVAMGRTGMEESVKVKASAKVQVKGGAAGEIPIELQDIILQDVDFPYGLEEAKELRLQLMEERKSYVVKYSEAFESTVFSLCEH